MKDNFILLNDQQWNILKQAAPHFESARHEYLRNCPRWLSEQVINVYEDATGNTILHKDLSCAVCVLRIFQTVGKLYFYNLEERKKLELKDAKQSESNSVGNAKSNRRNKKENKGSSR